MPGLSDAQETELNHLAAVIGRIVAAGTPTRLEATGVLECLSPGRRDYEAFAVRFACLPVRLLQLRKARKVVVNPKLPASMGANTRTSTVDGQLVVLDLELPPSLLVGNPKTRTARAITLLHELSHAVGEEEGLPIRDYTYRSSWAWRYLPDPVSWHNADTYADAAAQLAGELEQTPDRYLSTGCAVARRETLRDLPKLPLGTALAWADLKVNRAWLRSNDYQSFAVARSAPSRWDDDLAEYQRDLSWSGLAELEGQLQALGVVGRRWGFVNWGLDDADVRTAQLIYPWLNKVKDNLGAAIPQLSASATKVTYEAATAALTIPVALLDRCPRELGEMIIDAVIANIDPGTNVLRDNKHRLVDLLVMHDRKHESHQLARIAEQLRIENPGSKPSSEQCKSAQVDLDMATLNGISEEFTKSVRSLEELGAAVGLDIPSFHGFLKANVILASSTADRVLSSSRAPELAGSIQAIFSRIDSAVVRMAKAVTTAVPNGQLPIDDIQDVVTPYAYILYC